jgi:hypothetical protein
MHACPGCGAGALNAVRAGLDIREVPSYELPRRAGTSNLKVIRDGSHVLRMLLDRHRVRHSRKVKSSPRIELVEVEVPLKRLKASEVRRG